MEQKKMPEEDHLTRLSHSPQ